ncbi:hypothetical protein HNQ07_000354 [Deinococcus metalli]|nr:hypothetical protein [Deinococcus metalli]MBB5374910.1 hypothetical protein [Deinococcus metalli]
MLEAPQVKLSADAIRDFEAVWASRDVSGLPSGMPCWLFLRWLENQDVLFHGSQGGGLDVLTPQVRDYRQPDDFSNRTGVYASSDGLWAMMYALRGPKVTGMIDMGLRLREGHGWSPMRYFISLSAATPLTADGRALLAPGTVYVVPRDSFEPSPPYRHPGLGDVQEAHWVHSGSVRPVMAIPVGPQDFPFPVRVHDAAKIRVRAAADPWGFPWLDE